MMPRAFVALWFLVGLAAAPPVSSAQASGVPSAAGSATPISTIVTTPTDSWIRLVGTGGDVQGRTPLDLPRTFQGRFKITTDGARIARTQGVLYLPPTGGLPHLLSEPPGLSPGLLLRSLNFPGLPELSAGRTGRGLLFSGAGIGAGVGALIKHRQYRDRIKEFGDYSTDRARDERRARDSWLVYGGATWAASALDYMIRPRMSLQASTPTHVSVGLPSVSRGGAMWRSLFVPGAGQAFANHRSRGSIWLCAALATGAGLVAANGVVDHTQTKVDWAEAYVDSAGPSEKPQRARELATYRSDLQAARDTRTGFGVALLGIWAANLIDAAIMPIASPGETKPRLEASLPIRPGSTAVALSYRF